MMRICAIQQPYACMPEEASVFLHDGVETILSNGCCQITQIVNLRIDSR